MLWIKFKPWHTKIVCMAGWFSQISEYNVVGFDSSPCKEYQVTMRQTRMTWVILSIKGQYFSWIPCRKKPWSQCDPNDPVNAVFCQRHSHHPLSIPQRLVSCKDEPQIGWSMGWWHSIFDAKAFGSKLLICPIHKVFRNPQMHDLCPWIETFSVQDS